jgi:rhodanese-related sulfurtransferase
MQLLKQSFVILLLSVIAAVGVGLVHPKAPVLNLNAESDPYLVTTANVAGKEPFLWVDARSAEAYAAEHAPGAVNLNEDDWDTGFIQVLERWTPEMALVVYCDARECHASEAVAQRLRRELDFENVYYLEGGWESWLEDLK